MQALRKLTSPTKGDYSLVEMPRFDNRDPAEDDAHDEGTWVSSPTRGPTPPTPSAVPNPPTAAAAPHPPAPSPDVQPPASSSSSSTAHATSTLSRNKWLMLGSVSLLLAFLLVPRFFRPPHPRPSLPPSGSLSRSPLTKIAFGSCTSYHAEPQPIWLSGVLPFEPDQWLWLGDFAYLDDPVSDCTALDLAEGAVPESGSFCTCGNSDYMRIPPFSCASGSLSNARSVWSGQLSNPDYMSFLSYMCPNYESSNTFPPAGGDKSVCPRGISGVYDDHDFGWNDGNSRLEDKALFKELYLDALGVPQNDVRRSSLRGLWTKNTINNKHGDIDMFHLDGRYDRPPLPCHVRRRWCEETVLPDEKHSKHGWCFDFLRGGNDGKGTCCKKDEEIYYGYCKTEGAANDPLYGEACDIANTKFGSRPLVVDERLVPARLSSSVDFEDMARSSFCDVLGLPQRNWLSKSLRSSRAAVKLVLSGSVLLSHPVWEGENGPCSGDDWDCYSVARNHLLHMLLRDSDKDACAPIVLTGDYHFSDFKRVKPGPGTTYGGAYELDKLLSDDRSILQVMSSGMTATTAQKHSTCESYVIDYEGLRTEARHGACSVVSGPNFGTLEVDWLDDEVRISLRRGENTPGEGEGNEVLTQTVLDLKRKCEIKETTTFDLKG